MVMVIDGNGNGVCVCLCVCVWVCVCVCVCVCVFCVCVCFVCGPAQMQRNDQSDANPIREIALDIVEVGRMQIIMMRSRGKCGPSQTISG